MNRTEFIERKTAFEKSEKRYAAIWLPFFFSALIGNLILNKYLQHRYHQPPTWISTLQLIALFSFLFWSAWHQKKRFKTAIRKAELTCNHCDKELTPKDQKIVISTDRCPYCGVHIITNPNPA